MNPRKPLLALGACLALQACDTQIAGTNNETQTKGTFFQPGGAPDVGARVRIFQASNDSQPVRQTYVDAVGNASLTGLPHGYYSVLVQDTEGRASFLDSLYSDGDNLPAPPDTVRATATVIGHVQVQPMDSPAIAWIHLMRTGIYVNVDSTGAFRITGVPSDALTLVASTLLPQYTPTFRSIKPLPDSTLDVGTIDLVYNGIPLVTGIVASYDSLSGVVTLTWKDTTYARKNGYLVYKGQGAQPSPSQIGTSTMASFSDTVFGGFGATPSRYDSAEFDLTYWVAAQANDFTTGPVWNKVQLHVKSPALAKRWTVTWAPTIPLTGGETVDTLDAGLAILAGNKIQVLSKNGTWTHDTLPGACSQGTSVFWNGALWNFKGIGVRESLIVPLEGFDAVDTIPSFDSVMIYSTRDGVSWDSLSLAATGDSVTAIEPRITGGALYLEFLTKLFGGNSWWIVPRSRILSRDGSRWQIDATVNPVLDGYGSSSFMTGQLSVSIVPSSTTNWSTFSTVSTSFPTGGPPVSTYSYWLVPGFSTDTSKALLRSTSSLSIRDRGDLLALFDPTYQNTHFGIAFSSSPSLWQRISPPEPGNFGFCFWQGKLVVLGASGIHIATIQ